MRQQLLAMWEARTSQERVTLSVGGILALILILYLLVWDPIVSDRERLIKDLPKLRGQWAEFRKNADEAEALRSRLKSRGPGEPLPMTIEASARRANLGGALRSVQSLGGDRAQASGSGIQFDALIRWIAQLASSDGIVVDAVQVTATAEPGRVQLDNLVLRR